MTYEAPGSIWVVRMMCDACTDPICRCFNNQEGMNYEYLPSWRNSRVHELANGLRQCTTVPSKDLSAIWITMRR
jgi:hypothetical protein